MRIRTKNSNSDDSARCTFSNTTGRCRSRISAPGQPLCSRHAGRPAKPSADLTAAFDGQLTEFRTAVQVNDFLRTLTALLVESRISSRRAAVLAYIQNLLLRTHPAIQFELNPDYDPNPEPEVIFDIPRPDYSRINSRQVQQPATDQPNASSPVATKPS